MSRWDASKHPRGSDGRFGNTIGARHLKAHGVGALDLIEVLSNRVKKYAGFATVEEFVAAHPKGEAAALRILAADHKAGRIGFKLKPEPIDRSKLRPFSPQEHGGIKDGDYVFSYLSKYPQAGTSVGDFVKNHPKGEKHAMRVLKADLKAGRASIERPIADFPKVPRALGRNLHLD